MKDMSPRIVRLLGAGAVAAGLASLAACAIAPPVQTAEERALFANPANRLGDRLTIRGRLHYGFEREYLDAIDQEEGCVSVAFDDEDDGEARRLDGRLVELKGVVKRFLPDGAQRNGLCGSFGIEVDDFRGWD